MAKTTISKNSQGYGYKYTDLAEIHKYLESNGLSYYQYIESLDGNDYIYTVPITADGKELPARRGCRIVNAILNGKSNPAQERGSAITYARRYSLLMAFGLATDDDDAQSLTRKTIDYKKPQAQPKPEPKPEPQQKRPEFKTSVQDMSLEMLIPNPIEEDLVPDFIREDKITPKEVKLLENLCRRKGLDISQTFPRGIEALSPDIFYEAVAKLNKLRDVVNI